MDSGLVTSARYRPVPEASIRRLPGYHRLLKELQAAGVRFVSCSLIGKKVGKPKVGYVVDDLIAWLEEFLG